MFFIYLFLFILSQGGESVLHAAAKYGQLSIVEYLVTIHTNLDLLDQVIYLFFIFVYLFGYFK